MDDDDDDLPPPPGRGGASCACRCCPHGVPAKRKGGFAGPARVGAGAEASALREALLGQQAAVVALQAELEEERSASASAASEAMSMILRLQRERADALLEFRQFRRLAEERFAHDQQEIATVEDLLFNRDEALRALSLSCAALDADFEYPPLRCYAPDPADPAEDKYAAGETPRSALGSIERRIDRLERIPSDCWTEKGVVAGRNRSRLSGDGFSVPGSPLSIGLDPFPLAVDPEWDHAEEMSDRVCTVDAVHAVSEDYVSTPRELVARNAKKCGGEWQGEGEVEIKKLNARLQALEADRESMRQTIMAMGTDKAQVVLLREIAQQLCKEAPPERKVVKRMSFSWCFAIVSAVKWVVSFVFWRKNASRIRYTFGLSSSNVGLLLLLDKSLRMRQRRFLTRTRR